MLFRAFYFILVVNTFASVTLGFDDFPTVKVNQGVLNGKYMSSITGKRFSAFLSIPYAKAPVGDLRFKAPVPGEPWIGARNASEPHGKCPQVDLFTRNPVLEGNEDCLYLNVFSPRLKPSEKRLYPVMVFIHGGGYFFGSASLHEPDYLIDFNVVFVTFNYRLGPLGFLCTGDDVVPGNNGMKDQSLAIRWVHDNIRNFGGDPNQVTLLGESTGGCSTHLHYFSPLTKGLFHRGISQSGNALGRLHIEDRHLIVSRTKKLAQSFNCTTKIHNKMVQCLRKVNALDLIAKVPTMKGWDIEPALFFRPVIEVSNTGAFLSEHPLEILKSGKYANVPWLTGVNTEDGALRVSAIFKNPALIRDLNDDFNRVMSVIFENNQTDFTKVRDFYFGDKPIDNSTRYELVDLFGDFMLNFCGHVGVNLHLTYSKQPVYYYLYGYKHSQSFSGVFGEADVDYGTCHCDELLSLFPITSLFNPSERTTLDERVSLMVTTMWTNFAKTGNPTPNLNTLIQTKWEPVKTKELEYTYIGSNMFRGKNMFQNRMDFWKKFILSGADKLYSICNTSF